MTIPITTRDQVIAALDSYHDGDVAAAVKQAQDVGTVATQQIVDGYNSQMNSLKGDRDAIAAQLAEYVAKFGPLIETIMLPENFTNHQSGLYVPLGFTGKGSDRTLFTMRPMSSQRAAEINAIKAPATNGYAFMRMGGTDTAPKYQVDNAVAQGFRCQGTPQGHTVNGLTCGPGKNALWRDLILAGFQGELNGPPRETACGSMWGQVGATIESVVCDGRDVNGKPIASSPLMLSGNTDTTVNDLDTGYGAFGFALAIWHQHGFLKFDSPIIRTSRKLVNLEQMDPGTEVEIHNPVIENATQSGVKYFAQASTRNGGRATIAIFDPPGNVAVQVYGPKANATSGGNGMQDSDIKVYVRGADATSQRLTLVHA